MAGNTPTIPIRFEFDDGDFKKLASQMEELYKNAEKFAKAIKQGTDGGGGTSKAQQGLKATVSTMEKLRAKMEAYGKESQRAKGTIHGLESEMKKLKIQAQLATNPAKAKKYANEVVRIRKEITKAKDATRGWGKALGSFQFKFNALGNIAANVASSITNNITRALRDAVNTVIDFEKSFAEVLTLLNKGQKTQFKEVLKQNSVDIMRKYGLTIQDTNKAMFDAISAGVKVADVYDVLDAAARLAVGGVTDLNSATKGIASVMNAFSLEMSEAGDVASAFFQAQKFGITYIDEMVASMGRANTIASLSGASYRDMLAAFTAITKSGLNTEESITGLRNIFKELVSSSSEAATELNRIGIATGANAIKQRGFIGVLDDLNKAYLMNNEIIPKIFGNIRGLTGIMGIVGERYSSFRFILEQVNNAMASQESLNDAVNEQMNTTAKKLDVLSSSWNAFVIAITDGQSEQGSALKKLLDNLTSLVQFLTPKFYEDYTQAMDEAKIKTKELTDEIEKTAKSRASLFDNAEAADRIYTKNLLSRTRKRIAAAEEEVEKSQATYISYFTKLQELRDELGTLSTSTTGDDVERVIELTKQINNMEKSVDSRNVKLLKNKAIYEGLLDFLQEILKKETELQEEKDNLSDQERKNLITLTKLRRDVEIARIKLKHDGATEERMIENTRFKAELKLIDLSQKKGEELKLLKEKAELQHKNTMLEIDRKYNRESITLQSSIDSAKIELLEAGYEKEVGLAEETNKKVLDLIKVSGKDKETQRKLEEQQELEHQLTLRKIKLKYDKDRINLDADLNIAQINMLGKSRKTQIKLLEANLQREERLLQADLNNKLISVETYLRKLELLYAEFENGVAEIKNKPFSSLGDLLGLDEQGIAAINESINLVTEFTDKMVELAEKRIDAIRKEIDASDERTRSLQADRDHEWERMQQGYANNYDLKQRELEDEKKRKAQLKNEERKALEERKKVAKAQIIIDKLEAASAMVVAIANIWKWGAKTAPIGLIVAGVLTVGMLAAFAASIGSAKDTIGSYAEGVIDLKGAGTEKSDSIPARLSKGESVMTAKATRHNKNTLGFMQNNPDHPLFAELEKHGVNTIFNKLSDQMQEKWIMLGGGSSDKWDELLYQEMKTHNEVVRNRPYSYQRGQDTYTIEGNQITVVRKR